MANLSDFISYTRDNVAETIEQPWNWTGGQCVVSSTTGAFAFVDSTAGGSNDAAIVLDGYRASPATNQDIAAILFRRLGNATGKFSMRSDTANQNTGSLNFWAGTTGGQTGRMEIKSTGEILAGGISQANTNNELWNNDNAAAKINALTGLSNPGANDTFHLGDANASPPYKITVASLGDAYETHLYARGTYTGQPVADTWTNDHSWWIRFGNLCVASVCCTYSSGSSSAYEFRLPFASTRDYTDQICGNAVVSTLGTTTDRFLCQFSSTTEFYITDSPNSDNSLGGSNLDNGDRIVATVVYDTEEDIY